MNKRTAIIALAGVVVVGGGVIAYGTMNGAYDPPLLRYCEETLQKKLVAPSTYRRISVSTSTKQVDADEWLAGAYPPRSVATAAFKDLDRRELSKPGATPIVTTTFVQYDAANAFGTPLRSTIACEFYGKSRSEQPTSDVAVIYNQKSWGEFMFSD